VTGLHIRPLGDDDLDVLQAMLHEAANWRPSLPRGALEQTVRDPALRAYHAGWRRPGDRGVLAMVDDRPVGAAWYRSFTASEHGYGFVDAATPELTIAVAAELRGRGVGRALLSALLSQARLDGVHRLSLSVEDDNPARALYVSLGFETVARAGGASTMLVTFPGAHAADRRR
jgi:ribosomal protein S18 acetylase RimI-like enzyme